MRRNYGGGGTSKVCGIKKKDVYKGTPGPHVALGVNFIWQPSLGKMVAMILEGTSEGVTECHTQANSLNLLTERSLDVLPVPHGDGMGDHDGHVHHSVLDTDALVGPTPENEVVSGVGLSRAVRI